MKGLFKKTQTLKLCALIGFLSCLVSSVHAFGYDEQTFDAGGSSWRLTVPSGYRLELLVEMEKPRMLTHAKDGVLLAGSSAGKLYHIKPPYKEV